MNEVHSFGGAAESGTGHREQSSPTSIRGSRSVGNGAGRCLSWVRNSRHLQTAAFLSLDESHPCSPEHTAAGKARHRHSHTKMLVQECQQCYPEFLHHSNRGHAHIWCMETPCFWKAPFPQQLENPSGLLQVQGLLLYENSHYYFRF